MSNNVFVAFASSSDQPAPAGGGELWSTLIEFALTMRIWWTDLCGQLDLTPTQGFLLKQLKFETPVPMNALADTMACDASNVTGIVDKLEARGFLVRQGAENDRRVKMLVITDKGREIQQRLKALVATPPAPIAELAKSVSGPAADALRAVIVGWAEDGIGGSLHSATAK